MFHNELYAEICTLWIIIQNMVHEELRVDRSHATSSIRLPVTHDIRNIRTFFCPIKSSNSSQKRTFFSFAYFTKWRSKRNPVLQIIKNSPNDFANNFCPTTKLPIDMQHAYKKKRVFHQQHYYSEPGLIGQKNTPVQLIWANNNIFCKQDRSSYHQDHIFPSAIDDGYSSLVVHTDGALIHSGLIIIQLACAASLLAFAAS